MLVVDALSSSCTTSVCAVAGVFNGGDGSLVRWGDKLPDASLIVGTVFFFCFVFDGAVVIFLSCLVWKV